ncbi:cyclin-L2 [Achaetomium macrosporum]|uniref:Cyclin-L2 n=1 Tax=Achaetomium macrosporum TaxID=79813 RepID=A0AAN7HEH3_9PEZI|nr:cyclin-L2 [Achaetomium macrosporum]
MSHMANPLATPDQLFQRRSFGALPTELQDTIFFATQCLTQAAGILLELPQSLTAQANVLLARYWLVEPMLAHEFSDVSAAVLYLTTKCSGHPRSPRDLSNVYAYLLSPSSSLFRPPPTSPPPPGPIHNNPSAYYVSESAYHAFHTRLLALEARVLYALSFDTHVSLPHPLAVTYLQALDFLNVRQEIIGRRTVQYLNTALLSPQMLYLTSQPNALAVAAIYNAARDVGAKMPECEWWEVFDVDREELGFLVVGMRSVEGSGRKMREEVMKGWGSGMLTRRDVEEELGRRGISVGVGNGGGAHYDAEEEAARRMDEKMAEMEAAS